jgi:metal-responsive CopG/Arc/MetJ family transcriptional regulator
MTTPESTSVERIIITLPSQTLDALTELAERKGRSRATFMSMVLIKYVNARLAKDDQRDDHR